MSSAYQFGERLFIPSAMAPYAPRPGEPTTRPLWTYALDPAAVGLARPALRSNVPYEPLQSGPIGQLFAVANDTPTKDLCKLLGWSSDRANRYAKAPFDLNELALAMDGGLAPTTGDPRFAAQMTYAVCVEIYEVFRRALGRNPAWGPWAAKHIDRSESPKLKLKPYAFNGQNAYYDPTAGTLEFGYFGAPNAQSKFVLPGGLIATSLSRDVIAHEVTHAILDGMRAQFMRNTNRDVPAFHEAFADIVALFHHFMQKDLVNHALAQSRGSVDNELLLGLGRQFGEAINTATGGTLRYALGRLTSFDQPLAPDQLYSREAPDEPHARGSILVSAIFEAYVTVYNRQVATLLRVARAGRPRNATELPTELVTLLAEEASKVAMHFMKICIRAIDYCPPLDLRFGSYLRALVTADAEAVPSDPMGYRDAFIKAFRRRNIEVTDVRDLSEDSLRWSPPDLADARIPQLAFGNLRFTDDGLNKPARAEVARRATYLARFLTEDPSRLRPFGLHEPGGPYQPIVIESIRFAHRIGPDDIPRNELVSEIIQQRQSDGNTFFGGSTVLIGMDGSVRYIIRRRVDDLRRRYAEIRRAGAAGAKPVDFRQMHEGRMSCPAQNR